MFLVLHGRQPVSLIKERGFTVVEIPDNVYLAKQKQTNNRGWGFFGNEQQKLVQDLLKQGTKFMNNPQNRKMVFEAAKVIVGMVMKTK